MEASLNGDAPTSPDSVAAGSDSDEAEWAFELPPIWAVQYPSSRLMTMSKASLPNAPSSALSKDLSF